MQAVKQFTINKTGQTVVAVPNGATLLKAETIVLNVEEIALWYLVPDTDAATSNKTFKVFATEEEITDNLGDLTFVDSVVAFGGQASWHIFEVA